LENYITIDEGKQEKDERIEPTIGGSLKQEYGYIISNNRASNSCEDCSCYLFKPSSKRHLISI
jgi:hypothetical protein